ncbi:MAG: alpha/beta fold hydrolase [Hyphomicrobiales bacterium]|nr:alpha/beta fold hydrolase [Hyphomicrobiales bacterium]MCP5371985.1 alpha/beta fold hydrolase [Hyphomicrobiales bacterium]
MDGEQQIEQQVETDVEPPKRQGYAAGIDLTISQDACEWTVRALSALQSRLSLNIKLHDQEGLLDDGQILLFNHFARFETFIPQYLIYRQSGGFCRSVASREFFVAGSRFSRYLASLGGVPNDHPRLLPFLAEEVLRGRKVIVFPEGGMVKDRRVLDDKGDYSVYSPSARERRKHHMGSAVLAMTLDAFKIGIRELHRTGRDAYIEIWAKRLGMDSAEALLAAARKPTLIVPSNITFYPIRITGNLLQRTADLFMRGLTGAFSEEMTIEGNLLLKDTDMDIRLGTPIHAEKRWSWIERRAMGWMLRRIKSVDELFGRERQGRTWAEHILTMCIHNHFLPVRDAYMRSMYAHATINLSHLAATLINRFLEKDRTEVERHFFHRALYLAVKHSQAEHDVYLHRSLRNPDAYAGVLQGDCKGLDQFLTSATNAELLQADPDGYRFLPKLKVEWSFHEIRLENPIEVYANEAVPVAGVQRAVDRALEEAGAQTAAATARLRFDDELRSHAWDRAFYHKPRYARLNEQETATESGAPYLILPENHNDLGVLLVHGFLASPAELRGLGERLAAAGHPVMGVRLKGHGTSPADLNERTRHDWLASVRRGVEILSALAPRVCLVGFSTGGALSLVMAAEGFPGLAGVAAVATPIKFRNKNLIFVPLIRHANRVAGWMPVVDGIMPYRVNDSEHPDINYRNIPIQALYELRILVDETLKRLPDIACPTLVVQGDADPVVDPRSARLIMDRLSAPAKGLRMVPSTRHGILNENVGGAQEMVLSFAASLLDHRAPFVGGAAVLEETRGF